MTGRRATWAGVAAAVVIGASAALVVLSAAFRSLGSTRLYAALVAVFALAGLATYGLTIRVILPYLTGCNTRKISLLIFSLVAGAAFALFALPILPGNDVLLPRYELRITATGERDAASSGDDVTLLWFVTEYGEVSYQTFAQSGVWQRSDGSLSAPANLPASLAWHGAVGRSATLVFRTGPDAGVVEVTWSGQTERINLYAPESGETALAHNFRVTVLDQAAFLLPLGIILTFIILVTLIQLILLPTGIKLFKIKPLWSRLLLAAAAVVLLFLSFISNLFGVAERDWFTHFDRYSEGLILGRLVQSRQAGLFSEGGLTGYGVPQPDGSREYDVPYQYDTYFEGSTFGSYVLYRSQSGGQGIIFSLLDELVHIPPSEKFKLFQGLVALSSAAALGLLVFWLAGEFGIATGIAVMVGAFLSQWLVVFSRNLWWPLWVFYLPMLALMAYIGRLRREISPPRFWGIGAIVLVVVLVKALFSGYAYIPTVLIMMVTPLIYISLADSWQPREFVHAIGSAVLFSLLALLISFAILGAQLAAAEGGSFNITRYLVDTLRERTVGTGSPAETEIQACLDLGTWNIVRQYLNATFFDMNNFISTQNAVIAEHILKISHGFLMLTFLLSSGIILFLQEKMTDRKARQKTLALIAATWFSLLAPLSWFVIFKQHSCVHPHLNMIVWQMPFTLFGFATVGVLIHIATAGWRSRRAAQRQDEADPEPSSRPSP